MDELRAFINVLRSDGSIILNKKLAKEIGITETIIFSELLSRYAYFQERGELTTDGYFFNTIDDLEKATTLSAYVQRSAINKLVSLGLIDVSLRGLPARRYFKINADSEVILRYLSSY